MKSNIMNEIDGCSTINAFPEKINAINMYRFGESLLNKQLPEMIKLLKR